MSNTFRINELERYLQDKKVATTQELLTFYQKFEPNLSINTLRWRIWALKQQGIIHSPRRGRYALQEKKAFAPKLPPQVNELAQLLETKFPYVKFSIYPSQWLNNFSNHVYQTHNIIVEIDVDVLEAAFHFLKEKFDHTFLSPDQNMYNYYISPQEENIIIARLYADAPLIKIKGNHYMPKLEKLIVDLLLNDPIIFPVSESEIKTIIKNAIATYNINQSTLKRYAKKRYAENKLENLHLTEGTDAK